jgi:hypothetical protein
VHGTLSLVADLLLKDCYGCLGPREPGAQGVERQRVEGPFGGIGGWALGDGSQGATK